MDNAVGATQGGGSAAATENQGVDGNGSDDAQKFEEIFLQQAAFTMVFDGFSEEQRLRGEQQQRQNEDETIG